MLKGDGIDPTRVFRRIALYINVHFFFRKTLDDRRYAVVFRSISLEIQQITKRIWKV
jgi:hypothetical protein